MLKVLFVVNSTHPGSGAELVLADYLAAEHRIEKYLLNLGGYDNDALFEDCDLVESFMFCPKCNLDTRLSRFVLMGLESKRLANELKKDGRLTAWIASVSPNVVYFNNSFEAAVFKDSFLQRTSYICHIHDMVGMFKYAYRRNVIEACKSASSIITVSQAAKRELVQEGVSRDEIKVAYNPFTYEVRSPRCFSASARELRIGFVGSTIKRKGFDCIPGIVNGLSDRLSKSLGVDMAVSLVIATKSQEDMYYRGVISKIDSSVGVCCRRNLTREQTQKFYSSVDIIIVPSRCDPLPTVVIESIMNGVPCFASCVDGIPELLAYHGFMFNSSSCDCAQQAIIDWLFLSAHEQKSSIEACQAHLENSFTIEKKADVVFSSICEAAGQR